MPVSFTCPDCGSVSYNPTDVKTGYCGKCHWWTGDPTLAHLKLSDVPNAHPLLVFVNEDRMPSVLAQLHMAEKMARIEAQEAKVRRHLRWLNIAERVLIGSAIGIFVVRLLMFLA